MLSLGAAVLLLAGCGGDTDTGGFNDPCAFTTGALVGCPPTSSGQSASDVEDACWKLIDCNAFGVESDDRVDFTNCVNTLHRLSADRLTFALQCIGRSSCEDLRDGRTTSDPRTGPCFQFGENT